MSGYAELLESRFCTVLDSGDAGSYQGDEFYIVSQSLGYSDEARYGFGTSGYGSCSGCDALEAACDNKEINEIADQVYNGLRWFESKADLAAFLTTVDAANEWYANEDEWPEIRDRFIAKLTPAPPVGPQP